MDYISSIRSRLEFIFCKLATTTRRTSVILCSRSRICLAMISDSRTPTGDLHPEHCTNLCFAPAMSTSSISNVTLLQCGQCDMVISPFAGEYIDRRGSSHGASLWQAGAAPKLQQEPQRDNRVVGVVPAGCLIQRIGNKTLGIALNGHSCGPRTGLGTSAPEPPELNRATGTSAQRRRP